MVKAKTGKIYIYGVIGDEYTSQMLMETLQEFENQGIKDILVLINSPGGYIFDGLAIYNALKPLNVNVEISGQASSIASVVAMSGKEIAINENSFMMIHNPWTFAIGDSDYMQKVKDMLDELKKVIIDAYEGKTGKDRAEIEKLMNAETFMSAQLAVDEGFADRKIKLGAMQDAMNYLGYVNYMKMFRNQNGGKRTMNIWEKIKALFGWGEEIDEVKGLEELEKIKVKAESTVELPVIKPPVAIDMPELSEVVNQVKTLNQKITDMENEDRTDKVESLVNQAISDGKILPAMKDVYLNSAKLDFDGTKAKLDAISKRSAMPEKLTTPDLNKPQSKNEKISAAAEYIRGFNRQPQPKEMN